MPENVAMNVFSKIALSAVLAAMMLAATPVPSMPPSLGEPQLVDIPRAGETLAPSVAANGHGFTVSWSRKEGDERALELATLTAGKWSPVRTIASGKDLAASRANFPSIAVHGKTIDAQWVRRNGHGMALAFARSSDGGATWSKPVTPHPPVVSEFGFASMAVSDDGVLHALWIDGRGLEGGEEGHGDMQLRSTEMIGSKTANNALADPRVCDCCQTAMAVTAAGPVAVYRDRSAAEVRDISIVRWASGRWSEPATVHADGWVLKGCPVNGPRVAARGNQVVVVWYTAANDEARVLAAFSRDAGRTFGKPVRVDDGHAAGRVDVALDAAGSAIVSWVTQTPAGAELWLRRLEASGAGKAVAVATVPSAQAIGYPRLAISDDNALVAWSGTGTVPHVRTALINLRRK
jgi:hypothetical protein